MKGESSNCELLDLFKFLGEKWTVPLFLNIKETKITYNDLNRVSHNVINPTLLSKRIKSLVKFKIVKILYKF